MIRIPPRTAIEKPDPAKVHEMQLENISKALGTGKASDAASSIGELLRHRGMSQVSEASGIGRAVLYRSFGKTGNPTLQVLLDSLHAVGLTLVVAETDAENK